VNVAIYAVTAAQAAGAEVASAPLFQAWSLYPPAIAGGQWWRLITAGFLHFGPLHIGFNMLALWVIGKDFERVLGRARFLAVYLVGLLGGSASAFVFGVPGAQVAGASGAVFGLMGGLAVLLRRLRLPPGPAVSMIVINLVISFVVPGISVLGHLGGLVVGALATAAQHTSLSVLLLAWLVAVLIRLATGSATVATVTAAGIISPVVAASPTTNTALVALAIGTGSLFLSHVNDAGFWLINQYFGMSVRDTFTTWSAMETLISVVGMACVLALNTVV